MRQRQKSPSRWRPACTGRALLARQCAADRRPRRDQAGIRRRPLAVCRRGRSQCLADRVDARRQPIGCRPAAAWSIVSGAASSVSSIASSSTAAPPASGSSRCPATSGQHLPQICLDGAGVIRRPGPSGRAEHDLRHPQQRHRDLAPPAGDDGTLVIDNRIEDIVAGPGGTGQHGNAINAFRARTSSSAATASATATFPASAAIPRPTSRSSATA